ncbi:protein pigeon-like [Lineus longissimus]|uniref:protein pigeon-like n=1 Tax=Lineus longissimus TaxID=88925 RepID=UPI002B4F4A05
MLDFTTCFDGSADILPFVKQSSNNSEFENFKIVGQEKDGTILYVWDAFPINARIRRKVTHIGLLDGISQKNDIVFHHEKLVNIVNCSVNQDRSLIAFTAFERVTVPGRDSREPKTENRYRTFTAEVQPQKGMYKLNIEGSTHIQLQFLYGQHRGFGENYDKESHMIMLHHRESIGLYHFMMARVGERGWIVCDQPRTENIMKKYIWCQWDPTNLRLFVLYSRKPTASKSDDVPLRSTRPEDIQIKPVLTCYQFGQSHVPFEAVLDVQIPFPLPKLRSTFRPNYYDLGPTLSTPESSINMAVLTLTNGTICVCFQHPLPEEKTKRRSSVASASSGSNWEEESATLTLEYTVCMIHHGKSLVCSVPNVSRQVAARARMSFSWTGDYLLVLLPGFFIHLLNVTVELEPCHHIVLHDSVPNPFSADPSPYLTHFLGDRMIPGTILFDPLSLQAQKVVVDRDKTVKMFEEAKSFTQRLAILHYAVLHARDINMVKRLIEILCNDPFHFDLTPILQEFLISSTFGSVKRQLEKDVAGYFAFTTSETFRGNFEKNEAGTRIATFNYTSFPVDFRTVFSMQRDKTQRQPDDMWDNLCFYVTAKKPPHGCKFSNRDIARDLAVRDPQKSERKYQVSRNTPSLLKRLSDRARNKFSPSKSVGKRDSRNRPPSRSEVILGLQPSFLLSGQPSSLEQDAMTTNIVMLVGEHLKKFREKDSVAKIHNLALEYMSCMQNQARQLVHVVWSVFNMDERDVTADIKIPATEQETELFHVLERVYLATLELTFPLPIGFLNYFASLAFHALDFSMFMQYVNSHVISLTDEFVAKAIIELEDTPKNVDYKCLLISKLPQDQALACYQIWNHPISHHYLAKEMVQARLSEESVLRPDIKPYNGKLKASDSLNTLLSRSYSNMSTASVQSEPSTASDSPSGVDFPPLDTLMRSLEEADKQVKSKGRKGKLNPLSSGDIKFIEESALIYSQQEGYKDFHVNM